VLVAGQLAVSLALLCGGGLLLRTLHRLASLERGYEIDNRLAFQVLFPRGKYVTNEAEDAFWTSLYASVRAIPGVELVASGSNPLGGYNSAGLVIEDRDPDEKAPEVRWSITSDDYFRTLEIPIVRGRGFLAMDREDAPPVCVISAGLAATFWPGRDPVGARIKLVGWYQSPPWMTVVGVAGDVRLGAADSPAPTVYTFQRQDFLHGGAEVLVRTRGDLGIVGKAIPDAVRSVDPTIPVRGLQVLGDMWRRSPGIANRRLVMQLLVAFALLAVVVAAIGVYGVCAYAMGARAREFAIRIALGSPRRRVVWLALRDGIAAVGTGLLLGIPLVLALVFGIRSLLYEVQPLDPVGIAAGLGMLVLAGGLASFLPARRITRIDPAIALKGE
jgi:predicted permease